MPNRPTLPPKAGYIEKDGEYVKIPGVQDTDMEEIRLALAELAELVTASTTNDTTTTEGSTT